MKISAFYFSSTGNTLKLLYFTEKLINHISLIDKNLKGNNLSLNHFTTKQSVKIDIKYINIEKFKFIKNIPNFHKLNSQFYYIKNELGKGNGTEILNEEVDNIENILISSDIIILAFPVFFYQAPKIIYAFFDYIKYVKNGSLYKIFLSKPLILLSTNGGEPANSFYKLFIKYKLNNIVFVNSVHFEDNHPSLRQRFNPLISKGFPTKRILLKYKKKFYQNFIPFLKFYADKKEILKDEDLILQLKKKKLLKKPFFNPLLFILEGINIFYSNFLLFKFINKKNVNVKKCTDCKICINNCPTDALKFSIVDNFNNSNKSDKNYKNIGKNINFNIKKCIGCYRCINICSFNAINTHISRYGIKYIRYINLIKK